MKSPNTRGWKMTHSSIMPMEFAGRRMFVYCADKGVAGVAANDGAILWDTTEWKISIATVYRTVRLFGDAGILARHDFGDGRARYEMAPEEHHDHLIDVRTDLTERQRLFASRSLGAGKTLMVLLNDILDFSRIEAGKLEIVADPFELRRVVQDTVDLFVESAAQKQLALNVMVDPTLPQQLDWILQRALTPQRENRFTDAAEMVRALHAIPARRRTL